MDHEIEELIKVEYKKLIQMLTRREELACRNLELRNTMLHNKIFGEEPPEVAEDSSNVFDIINEMWTFVNELDGKPKPDDKIGGELLGLIMECSDILNRLYGRNIVSVSLNK